MKLEAEQPLLYEDNGSVRVSGSRVLLEIVITQYQQGNSPEQIQESFPTATLEGVYSAIAYYLRHKDEVEAYMVARERKAEEIEEKIKQEGYSSKIYTDERVKEI